MEVKIQKKNQGKTKILLTILVILLVLAAAAGAFLFVRGKMKEKSYSEAITSAEKYLTQNNYEDAIIQYEKAISLNPADPDAYLGLANVYVQQENVSKAKAILSKGYTKTNSPKIKRMLNQLNSLAVITEDQTETKEEPEEIVDLTTASQNIKWNTSFLQKILDFSFDDYKTEYGSVLSTEMDSGGYLEVVHSGLEGVFYYRNTESNKEIVDTSRKSPMSDGMPEKVTLSTLELLFSNFEGGVSLERLQMMCGIRIEPEQYDGRTIIEIPLDDLILRVETDSEGNITSSDAWNEILLLNANQMVSKEGHFSGVVLDAVTGDGIAGAKLIFTSDDSYMKDASVTANASGGFSVDLEPGDYIVQITAEGYIEDEFEIEIEEGKTYSGEQFVLSPELKKGTARIVLEWNAEPKDLDSYLFGETDDGDDVVVKWSKRQATAGGNLIAELDLDDRNGYGPETITIYDLNGVYSFQVADFNRTRTMKKYGATVRVYLPDKSPEVITIAPEADVKDIWIVCEIDHGELNILNEAPAVENFTYASK